MSIVWHDQESLYGTRVKALFFDGDVVNNEPDLAIRVLPFFATARPKALFTESDRKNFYFDKLVAQPDVVFEHGDGLISVEYKSISGKSHDRASWRQSIRLKDMLQCLIAGFVVAQNYKKSTACILRYPNVCYLLSPEPAVIHSMLELVPLAMAYEADKKRVSASELAEFSQKKIRSTYRGADDARSAAGRVAHETMLRR